MKENHPFGSLRKKEAEVLFTQPSSDKPTFIFFEWVKFDVTWFYLRQRPQHLARTLAKLGFQILFVEPPSSNGTRELVFTSVEKGIFRVEPWLDDSANLASCVHQLPKADWVIHYPSWMPILRAHLSLPKRIIYDCMDYWPEFPGSSRDIAELEGELASKADLVLASALSLYVRMKKMNPATRYVSNAVRVEDFLTPLPESSDLKLIPNPRLLFVGMFSEWVDLELIHFVAKSRPDWSLVLIGPSDINAAQLPKADNMHWLGKKPYDQLSSYLHHCDVGLIPFKQSRVTRAVNPLKAHEYVAAGLPVVSTFLPDLLLFDDPAVKVVTTYEQFVHAIEDVLGKEPRPVHVAGRHSGTWSEKIEHIVALNDFDHEGEEAVLSQFIHRLTEMGEKNNDLNEAIAEELALAHYSMGNFEAVLQTNTSNPEIQMAALVRLGQYDKVLELLAHSWTTEAFQHFFCNGKPLRDAIRACVLLENGEVLASFETLQRSEILKPMQLLLLARIYASLGQFANSLTAFSEIVEKAYPLLQPKDFLAIGDVCRQLDVGDMAEEYYLQAALAGLQEQAQEKLSDLYFFRAWAKSTPNNEEGG